jgi:hypothetical protein
MYSIQTQEFVMQNQLHVAADCIHNQADYKSQKENIHNCMGLKSQTSGVCCYIEVRKKRCATLGIKF